MPRFLRSATRWRMSPTEIGSTPAKGSSKSRYLGSAARQRAISTRRRSPPDRARAGARRRCSMENSLSSSSRRSRRLWRSLWVMSRIAVILSSTDRPRKIDISCGK
mmetsp:Transcript_29063/g.55859  ORF Transcript_29063/g.55859 Transcript_29063/m.55859 type:complete len:106 (+) Transcript_29063:1317-1634(+)